MQKHIRIYLKYFNIGETDTWICEYCKKEYQINNGLNIHHIYGRGKDKDNINNLMCLCIEKCHQTAHSSKTYINKEEFQRIHNKFLYKK